MFPRVLLADLQVVEVARHVVEGASIVKQLRACVVLPRLDLVLKHNEHTLQQQDAISNPSCANR